MRQGTDRSRRAPAALAVLSIALLALCLATPALAGGPFHSRVKSQDITPLNHACGAAVDTKGDLYAASAGESKVKIFNSSHAEIGFVANASEPCGLAVDTAGNLYVSEKATGKVLRYHPTVFPFAGAPSYEAPVTIDSSGNAKGIAIDRTDNRLYVAEGNHVAVYKSDGSFEASAGEGSLTSATGVAAYTYTNAINQRLYLAVADDSGDQVKLFSGTGPTSLKPRKTIDGVDQDANPETPNQEFGFGTAGAYLGSDPGNESAERKCTQVAEQACTAGHFFLYDATHEAVDELDASGEFVDQFTNGAFADAQPTAIAVDRSGGAGDGTVYASAGASAGAKLLAFAPLVMPSRGPLKALSHVLAGARAVATGSHGDVYVAAAKTIHVYDSEGKKLTSFEGVESGSIRDLAVDSKGNVYVLGGEASALQLTYYAPSKYPPDGSTSYTGHEPTLVPSEVFEGSGMQAVAVNPTNDHAFVLGNQLFAPIIVEFGSAAEGSPVKGECGAGLGLPNARLDIDVYGETGEVYVSANPRRLLSIRCGAEPELVREVKGGGCPGGEFGPSPAIAIDQSNGHVLAFAEGQAGGVRENETPGACVTQFGTFSPNFGGIKVAVDNSCALHNPPLTEATTPACASFDPANGNAYVAFDAENNEVQPYDLTAFGPLSNGTPPPPTKFKLTVSKAGAGTGTVTSSPAGIDCGLDCEEEYPEETKVTLTATPTGGSTFAGWSGSGCSGTGKCEVTMTEAKSVTAEFSGAAKPKFLLKVTKAGTGTGTVTSVPAGINCGIDCQEEYDEGTAVTLTGTAGANTKPVAWTGCDSVNGENKCLVAMSGAKEVTATFALEQHLLTVSKAGSGTGTLTSSPAGIECGATCSASFDHGTLLTLTATPTGGSTFAAWSGACSGTGTCEVTMTEAKSVTATFDEEEAGVLLTVAVEGSGTITSSPGLISCEPFCTDSFKEGTKVTLTATAAPGALFYSWKHCDSGGVNGRQCTVTMDKAKTVTAVFLTAFNVHLAKTEGSGLGKVQSSPGGILCLANCAETTAAFKEGTKVTLKQTPAKHFHFVQWLGDCTGSGPCELTMGEEHGVKAEFAEDAKHLLTLTKTGGGQGTVKSSPSGINCGLTCHSMAASFYEGELVELTATVGKGTTFGGWSGGGCSGTGICKVTMSEAKSVVAEFE